MAELCRDDRVCMFMKPDGRCEILTETYKKSGDCPFCKDKPYRKGCRENELSPFRRAELTGKRIAPAQKRG